jgi:hypothetical protein
VGPLYTPRVIGRPAESQLLLFVRHLKPCRIPSFTRQPKLVFARPTSAHPCATLFFFFPAAPIGPPPVFMGVHLLFEQRRLALVAEILVKTPQTLALASAGASAVFSIFYYGN